MQSQRIKFFAFTTIFVLGIFFRFSDLGKMIYSHDETYTSLHGAGYTRTEAVNNLWDGRIIEKEEIEYFLKPTGDKGVFDTLSALASSEPHLAPLYFFFAHYWMRMVGTSPAAMRVLSALLSLFAIPGMFWLSFQLFESKKVALISAVLISLSPYSILFAHDARPYSLWVFITLLSSAAFLTAIKKNKTFAWGVYALFIIIGLYSHLLFTLVIAAHGLYLVIVKESRVNGRFNRYLIVLVLAILAFTPWLYQIFIHRNSMLNRLDWTTVGASRFEYIQRWLIISASPLIDLYLGPGNILTYILRLLIVILIGYALIFLVRGLPKSTWAFLITMIGVTALPLLISDLIRGGRLTLQGRYFASTIVMIIPVIAYLIEEKLSLGKTKSIFIWYSIVILIFSAQISSAINISMSETWWNKNLSPINPQFGHVLNQASNPLLVVNGLEPTDPGDVFAITYMVDQDISFILNRSATVVELPNDYSSIYWFHSTFGDFINSESGRAYKATEAVPYFLWRIDR